MRLRLFEFLPRNVSRATIAYLLLSSIHSWLRIHKDYDRQSEIFASMGMPELDHTHRVWAFADRVAWQSKHDSLFTALGQLGAKAITCEVGAATRAYERAETYWRVDPYYVKVRAENLTRPLYLPKPWLLAIEAYSEMPFECFKVPKAWSGFGGGLPE